MLRRDPSCPVCSERAPCAHPPPEGRRAVANHVVRGLGRGQAGGGAWRPRNIGPRPPTDGHPPRAAVPSPQCRRALSRTPARRRRALDERTSILRSGPARLSGAHDPAERCGLLSGHRVVERAGAREPAAYTLKRNSTTSPSCITYSLPCLLYTSDAADEEDSVDLGGRRIIKKKKKKTDK